MQPFKHIVAFLQRAPLHVVLLPVYFIFSIYTRFPGMLDTKEVLIAFAIVLAGCLLLYGILRWLLKSNAKAAVLTTIAGIFYLFFGDLKNALADIYLLHYLSSYRFLLPLILLTLIMISIRVIRGRPTGRTNLFLNLLFIIYIIADGTNWMAKTGRNNTTDFAFKEINTGTIPDIYFILLDSYPSSAYQQQVLGVSHNWLDTALAAKGFWVQPDPRSNYNNTAFSMSSLFSMDYLSWMEKETRAKPHHFNQATKTIRNSPVFKWLQQQHYTLYNLSVLDIAGEPALEKERFLTATTTGLIFYNTFWERIKSDLLPGLFPSFRNKLVTSHQAEQKKVLERFRSYNNKVIDSLGRLPLQTGSNPKFVYAHLEMPHFPYFYDSSGKAYPDELVYSAGMITDKERFCNYIGYTNTIVNRMLDQLLQQTQGKAVIILHSDHGISDIPGSQRSDIFRNYAAFYFPGKDYHLLYTGMSNVNSFRIVFNKYFGQQLPLLKDSSIYIH